MSFPSEEYLRFNTEHIEMKRKKPEKEQEEQEEQEEQNVAERELDLPPNYNSLPFEIRLNIATRAVESTFDAEKIFLLGGDNESIGMELFEKMWEIEKQRQSRNRINFSEVMIHRAAKSFIVGRATKKLYLPYISLNDFLVLHYAGSRRSISREILALLIKHGKIDNAKEGKQKFDLFFRRASQYKLCRSPVFSHITCWAITLDQIETEILFRINQSSKIFHAMIVMPFIGEDDLHKEMFMQIREEMERWKLDIEKNVYNYGVALHKSQVNLIEESITSVDTTKGEAGGSALTPYREKIEYLFRTIGTTRHNPENFLSRTTSFSSVMRNTPFERIVAVLPFQKLTREKMDKFVPILLRGISGHANFRSFVAQSLYQFE